MKDNLNEEILRQLSLIKFDRGKTLIEQNSILVEFIPTNIYEDNTISEQPFEEPQPKRKGIPDGNEELGLVSPQEWADDASYEGERMRNSFCSTNLNQFRAGLKKSEYLSNESWNAVKNRYLPNGFFNCWNEFKKLMTSKQFADLIYKTWRQYYDNNRFVSTDTAAVMLDRYINEMNQSTYYELKKIIKSKGKFNNVIEWVQHFYFDPKGVGELPTFVDEKQQRLLFETGKLLQKFGDVPKLAYERFFKNLPKGYTFHYYTGGMGTPYDFGPRNLQKGEISGRTKDWVEGFHAWAPWIGMALQIFGGLPGMVIGSTLDFIDGLIYLNYDGDEYMATVSFIFALVPLPAIRGELGAARVTAQEAKTFLQGILEKLSKKMPLTAREELFLKGLLKNKQIMKDVGLKLVGKVAQEAAKEYGPRGLMRFFRYFHKLGYRMITGRAVFINLFGAQFLFDWYVSENWDNPKCKGNFQFSELIGTILNLFKSEGPPENWNPNSLRQWFLNSWLVDFPQPFTMSKTQCIKIMAYKMAIAMKKLEELEKENPYKIYTKNTLEKLQKNKSTFSANKYQDDFMFLVIQNFLLNLNNEGKLKLVKTITNGGKSIDIKLDSKKSKTFDYLKIKNASSVKEISVSEVTGKNIVLKTYNKNESIEISYPKTTSMKILIVKLNDGTKYFEKLWPGFVKSFPFQNNLKVETPIKFVRSSFDDNMKFALIDYQRTYGLEETGTLNQQTVNKMLNQLNSNFVHNFENLNDIPDNDKQMELYISELLKKAMTMDVGIPEGVGEHESEPNDEKVNKYTQDTLDYYKITPNDIESAWKEVEYN